MAQVMRPSTLTGIGLDSVLDMLSSGKRAADPGELVDRVFGRSGERGALVISGANGIVGAGKTMQLGSRLAPYGVPIVALDLPGAPDGIGQKYRDLERAFGRDNAASIMQNIVRVNYDGKALPDNLGEYRPRFLLEAIPEILELKKEHYQVFRGAFPDIEIRSVTSGFPSAQLGVGIAHPAFPHEINKVWEIVEPEPSDVTRLLWALGMIPIPVSDHWSFVLDVLFCGLTLNGLYYHRASNIPLWKLDKYIRRMVGPNPFRAHDAIGAKGANFLTWSCLHHLAREYGPLFNPTRELLDRKDSGQTWYPPNHFRPVVNWALNDGEESDLRTFIMGPLVQMASLMIHEERAELANMNIIGELCAQFRSGVVAAIRRLGADEAIRVVEAFHKRRPEATESPWFPGVFERMADAEWQQLYVNAERDGETGVITIGRESYNSDVDAELNRAIDWLRGGGVERVIITGDFHLATQMVGADTNEFFPALEDEEAGFRISRDWSRTARRLDDDFRTSVGLISGKRCLGGFLELMLHCHFLVAVEDASLGFPEVTLPVVPGMEGCHWAFRKTDKQHWPALMRMLLTGKAVKAAHGVGWLVDYAAPIDDALAMAWRLATDGVSDIPRRTVETGPVAGIPTDGVGEGDPAGEAARKAIADTVVAACGVDVSDALERQARHSAGFMTGKLCRAGMVGGAYQRTMRV